MTVMACDLGGTRIKIALVCEGEIVASSILPAKPDCELAVSMQAIAEELWQLCLTATVSPASCDGLAIGFPALVDSERGRVLNHYNKYRDAPQLDLPRWCHDVMGVPFAIENDARMALLGEWSHGAAQGYNHVAIITLGTGIGSAVISNGKLLRGPHFHAGNLCGHLVVRPNGYPCGCGLRGCVEAETGTGTLAARLRAMPDFPKSTLHAETSLDYEAVFKAAGDGDELALSVIEQAVEHWSILCLHIVRFYDVDAIVIGGGVVQKERKLAARLLSRLQSLDCVDGKVTIVEAEHPDHMALLGAEALLRERKHPSNKPIYTNFSA